MKVTNARFRPPPKLCDQCGAALIPLRPAEEALRCPNASSCGYPNWWGNMSQVVAVAVVRVRTADGLVGILAVQHNGRDDWELPAGFNPLGESSDACAVRETAEEATAHLDEAEFIHGDFETVPEGHLLAFHFSRRIIDEADLPPFVPNNEKQARSICFDPERLRFSTHCQAARDALGGRFDAYPARIPAPT